MKHILHSSKLKIQRFKCKISQKELSTLSGVPVKCIGNYEQLRRDINHASVYIVYRLAKALNCSIEELLEIDSLEK